MESHFDFYQFRWLVVLALNQLLIMLSVQANPLHTLLVLAVVTYPMLNMLYIQDLRKVDPYNTLLKSKKAASIDDLLPRSGLATASDKRETKTMLVEAARDSVVSVGLFVYLVMNRESLTPDFFHFVMCLGEDACHMLWTLLLWATFKCFFTKQTAHDDDQLLPENSRLTLNFAQGLLGLWLTTEFRLSTVLIFTIVSLIMITRLHYSKHMNMTLLFFVGIYIS